MGLGNQVSVGKVGETGGVTQQVADAEPSTKLSALSVSEERQGARASFESGSNPRTPIEAPPELSLLGLPAEALSKILRLDHIQPSMLGKTAIPTLEEIETSLRFRAVSRACKEFVALNSDLQQRLKDLYGVLRNGLDYFNNVPEERKTQELWVTVCQKDTRALQHCPEHFMSEDMRANRQQYVVLAGRVKYYERLGAPSPLPPTP